MKRKKTGFTVSTIIALSLFLSVSGVCPTVSSQEGTVYAADSEADIAAKAAAPKYDPRPDGTSAVRNQYWGTCWAQGAISTFESHLIHRGLENNSYQLSVEDVLWWAIDHGWSLRDRDSSGFVCTATGYLTTAGVRLEKDIPYLGEPSDGDKYGSVVYGTGENQKPANYDTASVQYEVTDLIYLDRNVTTEELKEMIVRYGAVTTSCYASDESFDPETAASYYPYLTESYNNHTISVVGWDDDFPKENFLPAEGHAPEKDGAWIIKNSFGTDYGSAGGFIYISYEDGHLFRDDSALNYSYAIAGVRKPTDRKRYLTDQSGATNFIASPGQKTAVYANVYDFGKDEKISELSFVSWSKGGTYRLFYAPMDGTAPTTDRTKWKPLCSGTIEHAGYMTVPSSWNSSVPEGKGAVLLEVNADLPSIGSEEPYFSGNRPIGNPQSDKGSGFILKNGTFEPASVERTVNSYTYTEDPDLCLRAYTVPCSPEAPTGKWKQTRQGWMYVNASGTPVKNSWKQIDGKWYFFDGEGIMESKAFRKGYYLTAGGAWDGNSPVTGWKQDSTGWWYSTGGKTYLKNCWKKIDGKWYYFKTNGYMAENEWVKGYYWLNRGGAWIYQPKGSWHKDRKGWWFGDTSGWYAKNRTYIIDGKSYRFNNAGYCINP